MGIGEALIWMPSIIGLLVVCVFMHELGHYLFFRLVLKKRIKFDYRDMAIKAGENKDYIGIKKEDKFALYLMGILFGMIPIGIVAMKYSFIYFVLIPYLAGCWTDIRLIWRTLYG